MLWRVCFVCLLNETGLCIKGCCCQRSRPAFRQLNCPVQHPWQADGLYSSNGSNRSSWCSGQRRAIPDASWGRVRSGHGTARYQVLKERKSFWFCHVARCQRVNRNFLLSSFTGSSSLIITWLIDSFAFNKLISFWIFFLHFIVFCMKVCVWFWTIL